MASGTGSLGWTATSILKSAQPHSNFSEPNGNSADIRIILFPMAVRGPFSMRNYIDTSSQAFMYTRRERCYLYDGPPVKSQPRFSITGPCLAAKGISGAHTTPRHNKQFVEALYFQQLRPCRETSGGDALACSLYGLHGTNNRATDSHYATLRTTSRSGRCPSLAHYGAPTLHAVTVGAPYEGSCPYRGTMSAWMHYNPYTVCL